VERTWREGPGEGGSWEVLERNILMLVPTRKKKFLL